MKAPTLRRLRRCSSAAMYSRERLEAPVDPGVERLHRHALDVLEGADDDFPVLGPRRGDPEAAVAHDHAGHPVPAGRGEVAVPQDLGVVVGVDVDEPGSQRQPVEVDYLGPGAGCEFPGTADRGDAVTGHRDLGGTARVAAPVDQPGRTQQKIHQTPAERSAAAKAAANPRCRCWGAGWLRPNTTVSSRPVRIPGSVRPATQKSSPYYHGAPGRQRRRRLPGGQRDRGVPGDDRRDHPDGLVRHQARAITGDHPALEGEGADELGVVVEQGGDHSGLGPGCLADRAAHLVDGDARDLGLALAHDGGSPRENVGPVTRRHAGPRTVVERRTCRAHRSVDVRRGGQRDLADDIFGRGRDDAETARGRPVPPTRPR